jgi:membrane-associated phospholipid phosphatase
MVATEYGGIFMGIEMQILDTIQSFRTPAGDVLMPLISQGLLLWPALALILLIRKSTRKAGVIMMIAMVLDVLCCNVLLKNLVQRTRPCDVNLAVNLLVARPTDYSFPSGHTALSFAAVSGFCFSGILKKWRIPAVVFACLIAFSRLYLYLHYPTDILAGAVVGIFCGWTAFHLYKALSERMQAGKQEEVTA